MELALVIPVFLMLLLATAELGRALYQYNALNKSVRDAAQFVARYGMVASYVDKTKKLNPSSQVTVEDTAKNLVVYGKPEADPKTDTPLLPKMTVATVSVDEVTVGSALGPTYVRVTATYDFANLSAIFTVIPSFGFGPGIAEPGVMTASVTMVGLGP